MKHIKAFELNTMTYNIGDYVCVNHKSKEKFAKIVGRNTKELYYYAKIQDGTTLHANDNSIIRKLTVEEINNF